MRVASGLRLAAVFASMACCWTAIAAGACSCTPLADARPAPTAEVSSARHAPATHAAADSIAPAAKYESAIATCTAGMIAVPGGGFRAEGTPWYALDEWLEAKSFCLDATEVTVAAYHACVQAGGCTAVPPSGTCTSTTGPGDAPVNCVTFADADDFCRWRGARLPTDAELGWAARGANPKRFFPWGSEDPVGRVCDRTSPCPVASFPAGMSPQGAYDLVGNVEEWTSTRWHGKYGPANVARGGSFLDPEASARASFAYRPDERHPSLGFRCASDGVRLEPSTTDD